MSFSGFGINWRGLITWVLVLTTTFLVSCGGSTVQAAPPTYTSTQLERIADYKTDILARHERMADLKTEIESKDWEEAKAIMSGPLGQMFLDMRNLNRNLLPQTQPTASKVTRSLFDDFVDIEQAGAINNLDNALKAYQKAEQDFDRFLQLLPES